MSSSPGRISSCRHEGEAVAWGCSRAAPAAKGTAASHVLPSANFSLTLRVQHLFLLHGRSHQLPARGRNRERRSLLPARLPASRSLSGSVVRKGPNPAAVGEPLLLPPLSSPVVAFSSSWMHTSGVHLIPNAFGRWAFETPREGFPCPKPPRGFPVLCPALLPVASRTSLSPDATRSISARTWDETRSGPAEKAAGAMRVHPWGFYTRGILRFCRGLRRI